MLWWLILCVNWIELRDAQRVSKTLFLGVSVQMFLEEVSIWVGRLSKEDCPHQCMWASSSLLKGPNRTKRQRKGKFALFACDGISIFCPHTSVILVLGSLDLDWIIPPGLPVFQFADNRLQDFLASIIAWAKYYNQSINQSYWFFSSREPWLIQSKCTAPQWFQLNSILLCLAHTLASGDGSDSPVCHLAY